MPTMPISLTDIQLDAVLRAAAPLLPQDRSPFLEALAHALQGQPLLGDGVIHRTIAETQKRFFTPPRENGLRAAPKLRVKQR
jgi:hypothetical protein